MADDWLLVETLGIEPVVVAEGTQPKNLVTLSAFLRRSPHIAAIRTAIAETVHTGQPLASITPKNRRVIRTEPVQMPDGKVHGVHVWSGPAATEPPDRPIPGPLVWDLTLGVATDTPESRANSGASPPGDAGAFTEELPTRDLTPNEKQVLALAIKSEPGQTLCSSWDVTDWEGNQVRVGFVVRNALETGADGRDHLIARGMNWRGELHGEAMEPEEMARQVLDDLAQPGVYRALVDLNRWALVKWLDEPCPFYDWSDTDSPRLHPDDEGRAGSGVLRLRGPDDTWVPVHVTLNQVEVGENTFAGLIALRMPTSEELAEAETRP